MNAKYVRKGIVFFASISVLLGTQIGHGQTVGIYRELWSGLSTSDTSLNALTNPAVNANWPAQPNATYSKVFTVFETETNLMDGYGERLRAFIVPPTNGQYVFWIATDDSGLLLLSQDERPEHAEAIAWVSGYAGVREWGKEGNQQSDLIYLVGGRRYYLEALMKEGGGGDNLAVRWQLPNGVIEEPISASTANGTYLIPFRGVDAPPGIFRQPAKVSGLEGGTATFSLLVTNQGVVAYQWQVDGNDIEDPWALFSGLTITNLNYNLHHGRQYRCIVSNALGLTISDAALLEVIPDTTPPMIVSAMNALTTNVVVRFSEPLNALSAVDVENYAFDGGVMVMSALLLDDSTMLLNVSPLSFGTEYTLTVNGVRDRAAARNLIATDSQVSFTAFVFAPQDVGSPEPAGSSTNLDGGFDLAGGGLGIGGSADQFQFNYQLRVDDFDVRVRVQSLSDLDAWTKAGLMARESLDGGSRFAGVFATPALAGTFFESRTATSNATTISQSFPVSYPDMWLRLQRVGDQFTGYAGMDGTNWVQLGLVTLPVRPVYLGVAVTSRNTNQTAQAELREFSPVTEASVGELTYRGEPLGPSSRRTPLVISEIMYHPRHPAGVPGSLEFIELYNPQAWDEDLSGHRLSGAVDYAFPSGTVIKPGHFLVVARAPGTVQNYYGITGVLGPWIGSETNSLPGGEGTVRLRNPAGAVLLEVQYRGGNPWPIAADGAGHSLVLWRPSFGENNPLAWTASYWKDGSPGKAEPFAHDALESVFINEFLANSEAPLEDYLELYNHSNDPVDLSGAYLSDEADTNKFQIPSGTVLPPRGFLSFGESTLGFALRATGERIFLVNRDDTRVVDTIDFAGQANGVSSGRAPDGSPDLCELAARTPGAPNGSPLPRDIVINEIMYSPISGDADDEYLELYNRGAQPVDVSLWQFVDGVSFTIPNQTLMPPGGYLVVARNRTNLLAHYPGVLTDANTVGNYSGSLANGGERLALAMPEYTVTTDPNTYAVTIDTNYVVVNEVTYGDGGRWGTWSDGGGSSLELKDPRSDNRRAANWADSDELAKSEGLWTTIDYTNTLGETLGSPINDKLQVYLLDVGECLVDNLEVRNSNGTDVNSLGANGTFESGQSGWTFLGSHDMSTVDNVGFSSSHSLHLRAASRGDNGPNMLLSPALSSATVGQVALRAKARWLRGWPELLLRVRGGGIEVSTRLQVPPNLGSPGLANSRRIANAGPAIWDVVHSPILPAASEAVVVTARAIDPDGIASMRVRYRLDPSTTFATANMMDDGTGGDAVAGDGVFSATLPGQSSGATVAFYLEGVDSLNATNLFPQVVFPTGGTPRLFPLDATSKECLIRWGEVQKPGSFATYHEWVSAGNFNRWDTRAPALNNAFVDCTFVYNNYRVIYNAQARYAGSPWHRGQMDSPTAANRVDFDFHTREDDLLLGETDFVFANPGNPSGTTFSDLSLQSEQTSYLIFKAIGLPYNYRRYIHFFLNGSQRSTTSDRTGDMLMEDAQQPNGSVVSEWYPDSPNNEFFKIEDWFEFPDNGFDFTANNDADITRRTVTYNNQTSLTTAPYRYMFRHRSVGTGHSASDYSQFFRLVDAASPQASPNVTPVDVSALETVANVEQWMRIFACQHTVGNWDSYGYRRGKNSYMYLNGDGRYEILTWDIDFTVGLGGDGTTQSFITYSTAPDVNVCTDPRIIAMWDAPAIRRMYFRAFKDIIDGPLNASYLNPILDAKAAAFTMNNITYDAGQLNTIKSYITGRNSYIAGQIPRADFTVAGSEVFTNASNLVTLTGTAPVAAKFIGVNGQRYPVTWTTAVGWQLQAVLEPGTNVLNLQGYDRTGQALTSAVATVTVVYEGPMENPEDLMVISEILYHPATPGTSFVELYNSAPSQAFDLSGWRLNGADFTFPDGTVLPAGQYCVVVADRAAFALAFGNDAPIVGVFAGQLDNGGETLALVIPGTAGQSDVIVDQVRYDDESPWPAAADGNGPSLQLLDPHQDRRRVSNWSEDKGWRHAVLTGVPRAGRLSFFLESAGELYLDNIEVVEGDVAGVGDNLVQNGGFEEPLGTVWRKLGNHSMSDVSSDVASEGTGSLHIIASDSGNAFFNVYQVISSIAQNSTNTYTLSFEYLTTTNASRLAVRFGSGISASLVVQPIDATPGESNTVGRQLPPYDPLWLNEVQPENDTGLTDGHGDAEPWIELYNAGPEPLDLSGYYLANNYTNLTQWPFPVGTIIAPNEFKIVWADGEPDQTIGTAELHTSFALPPGNGEVALVRLVRDEPQITDYLSYSGLEPGWSYGDYPDGQPLRREKFSAVSPGENNTPSVAPVFINEWMASNSGSLRDPADDDADDWLELYNPNSFPVDLSGYYLSDNLNNPTKFRIPAGTVISAQDFLLFWADEEGGQNGANHEVHTNFKLSADGEELGLYSPARLPVDAVTFGQQFNNVSMGRYPNGTSNLVYMPSPTPRISNVLQPPNSAPVLAAIGDQQIRPGQTLSFQAAASDPDVPTQGLLYSIDPGAPLGASIHPYSGRFVWSPPAGEAPSQYWVTLRVTDTGNPPMQDSASFYLTVIQPPVMDGLALSYDSFEFRFSTAPGKTYRVESTDSLAPPVQWRPLRGAESINAAGNSITVRHSLDNTAHRFYRVIMLE